MVIIHHSPKTFIGERTLRMENSAGSRHLDGNQPTANLVAQRPPIPSFSVPGLDSANELVASQPVASSSNARWEDKHMTQEEEDRHADFQVIQNDNEEGGESVSSSFSYDDDDESSLDDEDMGLSLQERMLRNQERNAQFLQSLKEKYQIPDALQPTTKAARKRKSTAGEATEFDIKPRGMLRTVKEGGIGTRNEEGFTLGQRIQALTKHYPYRESQINRLAAILHASIGTCSAASAAQASVHVPAPIFISGPPSTGKTSIVRGVLKALRDENLHTAYLHCAIMEPASVERLVLDAYKQLRTSAEIDLGSSRRHKRRRYGSILPSSSPKPVRTTPPPETGSRSSEARTATQPPPPSNRSDAADDTTEENQPRLQPRRAVKETSIGASVCLMPSKPPSIRAKSSIEQDHDRNGGNDVETSHSAIVAFGRSLARHFGPRSGKAAVMVLDHAECLLTLSARKKTSDKSNCLAELLLLPKVMRLNLTILVISRYSLLQHTRLDNLASAEKATATLAGGVVGLTIQFPAYNTRQAIIQVLKTDNLLPLIIGRGALHRAAPGSFLEKVIDGFLSALVQLLSDTSMDINEFVRIGRSLWPVYIQALDPTTVKETLKSLDVDLSAEETQHAKYAGEVLGLLSRRFFSQVGKISKVLTTLPMDSTGSMPCLPGRPFNVSDLELPYLRTCLLLAAFICQKNRAENDTVVFSVHGNGKRRKSRNGTETNEEEAAAFATGGSGMEKLRSLRPRPFLVERMLSIFVTLVRLNPDSAPKIPGTKRLEFSADSLGTARLYDDFRSLVDLGFIHEAAFVGASKGEEVSLNAAKVWCSLTDQEASYLASTVGIPLDSYLV